MPSIELKFPHRVSVLLRYHAGPTIGTAWSGWAPLERVGCLWLGRFSAVSERRKPPNHLLREARRRLPSPSGSGRPMSRQELADAVNAYLASKDDERYQREATLDENHIGKLERGAHRWMNDMRREAFRHVLKAASDAELGFWIIRGLDSESPVAVEEGPLNLGSAAPASDATDGNIRRPRVAAPSVDLTDGE